MKMSSDNIDIINRYISSDLFQYLTSIALGFPEQEIPYNGSISLINLNGIKIGITCYHVLKKYWELKSENSNTVLMINRTEIKNVDDIIIDFSEKLDIVTLNLENIETHQTVKGINYGTSFFSPPKWPPEDVTKGGRFSIVGFPGETKFKEDKKVFLCACSIAAQFITDFSSGRILSEFDRKQWRITRGNVDSEIPTNFGGFSGGPAFVIRNLTNTGLLYYEFIGIVTEQTNIIADGIFISRANNIKNDGYLQLG